MKNLLTSLIVWLMLVAVPFQGFAGASMLTCAPAKVAAPAAMPAGHCDSMKMSTHLGMASHHAGAADAADPSADHSSPHHHAAGKCSTCASCCFGVAMAPAVSVARVRGETGTLAHFAFLGVHVPMVDLDLPERPPKTSLI